MQMSKLFHGVPMSSSWHCVLQEIFQKFFEKFPMQVLKNLIRNSSGLYLGNFPEIIEEIPEKQCPARFSRLADIMLGKVINRIPG